MEHGRRDQSLFVYSIHALVHALEELRVYLDFFFAGECDQTKFIRGSRAPRGREDELNYADPFFARSLR